MIYMPRSISLSLSICSARQIVFLSFRMSFDNLDGRTTCHRALLVKFQILYEEGVTSCKAVGWLPTVKCSLFGEEERVLLFYPRRFDRR